MTRSHLLGQKVPQERMTDNASWILLSKEWTLEAKKTMTKRKEKKEKKRTSRWRFKGVTIQSGQKER